VVKRIETAAAIQVPKRLASLLRVELPLGLQAPLLSHLFQSSILRIKQQGYDGQCRNLQNGDGRNPIVSSFSGMTNADSHDSDHIPTLPCKIGPPFS